MTNELLIECDRLRAAMKQEREIAQELYSLFATLHCEFSQSLIEIHSCLMKLPTAETTHPCSPSSSLQPNKENDDAQGAASNRGDATG